MYFDIKTRIRRFLRDPNERIWSDAFLLNLWNNEQRLFWRDFNFNRQVMSIRHPPFYQFACVHEWEYDYGSPEKGKIYQCLLAHDQSYTVCAYFWEIEILGLSTGNESDTGYRICQPWEGYCATPADLVPNWFPVDYHSAIEVFWDLEPINYLPWKILTSKDVSYRSYAGKPLFWTVKDETSSEFYLYPRASAVFDDIDGDVDLGMVAHTDFTTEADETGTGFDATGAESTENLGLLSDYVRADDNVLLVYKARALDIVSDSDDPNFPAFFNKYIKYGVLARAFKANTDGQIKSLADYWTFRQQVARQVLDQFDSNRLVDRDFRLTSQRGPVRRRKGPRLPSTYPAI